MRATDRNEVGGMMFVDRTAPARQQLRDFTMNIAGLRKKPPFTEQYIKDRRELLKEMWSLVHAVVAVELRHQADKVGQLDSGAAGELRARADVLDPGGSAW